MKIANTKDAPVLIVDYNAICTLRSAIAWSGQEQFFATSNFKLNGYKRLFVTWYQ